MTQSEASSVYSPGITSRSKALVIVGAIFSALGLAQYGSIMLFPDGAGFLVLTFWTLPVGIGALSTGIVGLRYGYLNFNGFFVSPLVWGATIVLGISLVGTSILASSFFHINNSAATALTLGWLVLGFLISGIMALFGFIKSGRRTLQSAKASFALEPGGNKALPVLALVFGIILAPLGILFGHLALSQINRKKLSESNRGLAVTGLGFGYLFTAFMFGPWLVAAIQKLLIH
jgi:hypothetical protein